MASKQPETFNLHVPDAALADLRERLSRTRFPDQAPSEHGLMARISIGWQDLSTIGEIASTGVLKRRGVGRLSHRLEGSAKRNTTPWTPGKVLGQRIYRR